VREVRWTLSKQQHFLVVTYMSQGLVPLQSNVFMSLIDII